MTAQPLALTAADGVALTATLFRPAGPPRHAVLIAGALGVPQRHYAPFAEWLASRGHVAMTFDPRGIGASRAPEHARSLRGLNADMLTWAQLDFAAAVQALCSNAARAQVAVIGHSLGAHHAGMTDASTQARLHRLVAVAAGAGYWRDWAAPSRRRAPLLLHLAAPLLTALCGYFPGKRFGMIGDLPRGVVRQWGRWCRHPGFAWGAQPELVCASLTNARFAVHALSFSDDEAMTIHCTRTLFEQFASAAVVVEVIEPASLGLPAIGHLGAFRPASAAALWPLIEQRLGDAALGEMVTGTSRPG
jgi:predicted alpha/beta hydrolase